MIEALESPFRALRQLSSVLAVLGLLAACDTGTPRVVSNSANAAELTVPHQASDLREIVKNRTVHYSFGADGVQLESYQENGRAFLWFPNEDASVEGLWRIEDTAASICTRICRKYPIRTFFNPDQPIAGTWNCKRQQKIQERVIAIASGDPFHFSEGTVPFEMGFRERWPTSRIAQFTPEPETFQFIYKYGR